MRVPVFSVGPYLPCFRAQLREPGVRPCPANLLVPVLTAGEALCRLQVRIRQLARQVEERRAPEAPLGESVARPFRPRLLPPRQTMYR